MHCPIYHRLNAPLLQGSIPYVPFLRAPYYVWIGRVPQLATIMAESKTEAPSGFPATFLYTQSWEDPRPDMQVGKLAPSGIALLCAHQTHLMKLSCMHACMFVYSTACLIFGSHTLYDVLSTCSSLASADPYIVCSTDSRKHTPPFTLMDQDMHHSYHVHDHKLYFIVIVTSIDPPSDPLPPI